MIITVYMAFKDINLRAAIYRGLDFQWKGAVI